MAHHDLLQVFHPEHGKTNFKSVTRVIFNVTMHQSHPGVMDWISAVYVNPGYETKEKYTFKSMGTDGNE